MCDACADWMLEECRKAGPTAAVFEVQLQMQMQIFAFAIAFALATILIQNLQHTLRECGRQQSDLECQWIPDLSSRAMWTSTFKTLNLLVQKLKPVRLDLSETICRMETKRENQAL